MNVVERLITLIFGDFLDSLTEKGDEISLRIKEKLYNDARQSLSLEREKHSDLTDEQFINLHLEESSYRNETAIQEAKILLAGKNLSEEEFEMWRLPIQFEKKKLLQTERQRRPQAPDSEIQSTVFQKLAVLIDSGDLPPIV